MVQDQLVPRGISNQKVLDAFYKVERHKFIAEASAPNAYEDYPLPIGENQTISQPYIVALMTQCLDLNGQEKVLEIGTGSGYQAAILAELAKEVYTVERIEGLSVKSRNVLNELGYKNIKMKLGDGSLGWPEEAPFERIIVTAASSTVSLPLLEQLRDGGKLILPLGGVFSQVLTLVEKKGGRIQYKNICGCVFVPLVGKYGLKNE